MYGVHKKVDAQCLEISETGSEASYFLPAGINADRDEFIDLVLFAMTRLHDKQTGIVQSKVITAKALDEELMAEVTNYLNGIEKGEKVEVSFNVNKKILGGLVVKYGDRILDNSLKTRLNQLKTSLLK